MGPGCVNDVMHRKRAQGIWGIWEKSLSWVFASEGRWLTFGARRGLAAGFARGLGQVEKLA